jgi:hypothetical protein
VLVDQRHVEKAVQGADKREDEHRAAEPASGESP